MPSPKSSQLLSKPTNKTIHSFKSLPCKKSESLDYNYSSTQDAHHNNNNIDLPPDSYWVPKEDEKDWFDQNAIIFSRTSSRKLSYSGCPTHHHVHQENLTPHRSSLSYNYTSSKAPFIGLPVGLQKPSLPGGHHRHHKAVERRTNNNGYFLRSRSEPGSKSVLQVTEPASPQVNCLGKVGTKKEKVEKKTGVWQNITTVFKTGFNNKSHLNSSTPVSCDLVVNKERTGSIEEQTQHHSLAGLMRLRSGRRSSMIFEPKGE